MWMFHLIATLLLCFSKHALANSTMVSYKELEELNATCPQFDTCVEGQYSDSLLTQKCSCESDCSEFGTCCINSKHSGMKLFEEQLTCRTVNEEIYGYLFIDKCPSTDESEKVFKSFCEDEWDGQDDAMLVTPVTSLVTNKTYKNYYCFRCHNEKGKFLFWNVQLSYFMDYYEEMQERSDDVLLVYNTTIKTWTVPGDLPIPVNLSFEVPDELWSLPKKCISNVKSSCAEDWKDDEVRNKCNSYMYLTHIRKKFLTLKYKNPHCALCNFEDLSDIVCEDRNDNDDLYVIPNLIFEREYPSKSQKPFFSFTLLLDVNRFNEHQTETCDDNSVWDPFFKKCRVLQCALPGYTKKDGKCEKS